MSTSRTSPEEIREAVATHTTVIPALVNHILAASAILATEAERYQIVDSLDNADFTLNAGRLPRWEYHPTSEQMQARNSSDAKYMYLYWAKDRYSGSHKGPGGKRKTYVGARPTRQALARALDANLTTWERLQRRISDHSYKLDHALSQLGTAAYRLNHLSNEYDETLEQFSSERVT